MKEQKITKFFTSSILTIVLSVMLTACGGDQGIREPLLEPEAPAPAPAVGTNNFAVIRGNYFLLESNCPQDDSALQVSQEQEAVFMTGGFTFGDEAGLLKGFVDENGLTRFFNEDNISDPNCTAQVEGPLILGACTYVEGIEATSCRFAYSKLVGGFYNVVWNDCDSDDSVSLEVQQSDNEITLINGFDYTPPPQEEVRNGVIERGKVVFNIDVLNPGLGINVPDITDQFNCEATVSGNLLTGRCRDLTVEPATICTFGYENTLRTADVDLGDDSLFPAPAISPDIIVDASTNMAGTYAHVSNDCEDDGGNIVVTQSGSSLGFLGGFDYQPPSPDLYAGSMSSNSSFAFSVLGSLERAFCTADLSFTTQGIAGFIGSCNVVDMSGNPVETCSFTYSRL